MPKKILNIKKALISKVHAQHTHSRRHILGKGLALLLASPFLFNNKAFADNGFTRWIIQFKATALKSGISSKTYDLAFKNINAIDEDVLKKTQIQPEFVDPSWNYFDNRINEEAILEGKKNKKKWQSWLLKIEKRFGVDQNILLAIWSMETNYGAVLNHHGILHNVIQSLATLAYKDKKRQKFAKTQLIAALKILQTEKIAPRKFLGSWAGAMGHTQFIPTSYLEYAVDMDRDGTRDIWNSVPDALASAANLLAKNGWETGRTFAYEIILPAGKFPSGSLPIHEWEKLGIKRANGQDFPFPKDEATLKLPDDRDGPIFLVIKNFFVLKRYNNADRYAFAVGLLAEQIAGFPKPTKDWNRPFTKINMQEKQELQTRLKALGYYSGEIDGKIGSASKLAIKTFQEQNGLDADGFPSREVLSRLRAF